MAKVELKGSIERIVRAFGKAEAQVLVSVPMAQIMDVPLGRVNITIETLQKAFEMPGAKVVIETGKPPVRGVGGEKGRRTAAART